MPRLTPLEFKPDRLVRQSILHSTNNFIAHLNRYVIHIIRTSYFPPFPHASFIRSTYIFPVQNPPISINGNWGMGGGKGGVFF